MRLSAILAAATLSSALACTLEPPRMEPEPRVHEARVEWRSHVGIHAARTFVLESCVDPGELHAALEAYGRPYNLSARDVAESILWGLFNYRSELPPSSARTLNEYLDEQIDVHGERFLDVTRILFGDGPYDRVLRWYLYDPIRNTIGVESTAELSDRVAFGLSIARWFIDIDEEYERLRASWD